MLWDACYLQGSATISSAPGFCPDTLGEMHSVLVPFTPLSAAEHISASESRLKALWGQPGLPRAAA